MDESQGKTQDRLSFRARTELWWGEDRVCRVVPKI